MRFSQLVSSSLLSVPGKSDASLPIECQPSMSVYNHYPPNYASYPGYPPQGGYASSSYNGYGYAQPPPPPPAPVPAYPHDPTSFRQDYMGRLSQLEFNSRPIIQSLSMIAQDYARWADIVAQCLEDHIRMVSTLRNHFHFNQVSVGGTGGLVASPRWHNRYT